MTNTTNGAKFPLRLSMQNFLFAESVKRPWRYAVVAMFKRIFCGVAFSVRHLKIHNVMYAAKYCNITWQVPLQKTTFDHSLIR